MKREKISIKWKIFLFLLAFILILLVVLWLFQICYLGPFYKFIRSRTAHMVRNQAITILQSGSDDAQDQIDLLAARNNVAIYVTDTQGNPMYNAEYIATSRLNTIPKDAIAGYYQVAKEQGGSLQMMFKGDHREEDRRRPPWMEHDSATEQPKEEAGQDAGQPEKNAQDHRPQLSVDDGIPENTDFMQNHGQDMAESILYVQIVQIDGQEMLFFLNCMLTPVDATVDTLKIQLLFITLLMIVLSLVLAFLIARQISKSMIRVNNAAKELAKGRYDVVFDGRDYREIAELSDTLMYTAKELGQTETLRRELIANVSHDLRTPLTMIIAYAEVMQDLPGENTPENIQVVIDEARRLTNLVNDMIDLSKLQAGVTQIEPAVYNLTDSIRFVLGRYNKLIEQEGYRIMFEPDQDVFVKADEYKLYQVIYNLINNAINYTGEDKTVTVCQITDEKNVRIEVSDSGAGIPKDALPYVWDRYYKVDKNHKRAVAGTGLGLSIVKNILDLHGASCGVESEEGCGSTFWFSLRREKEGDC